MPGFAEAFTESVQRLRQGWYRLPEKLSPTIDFRRALLPDDEASVADPNQVRSGVSLKPGRRGLKSVHKLLDSHDNIPSDPINVSDDEPDQSSEVPGMSNSISPYLELDQSSRKTGVVRQNNTKTLESRDERTLLGTFAKRDQNDTIIHEPTAIKRPFLSGALKPINTLRPNSGSRTEYFHSQRADSYFESAKRGNKQNMGTRENNHNFPQKRPRTRRSPTSVTTASRHNSGKRLSQDSTQISGHTSHDLNSNQVQKRCPTDDSRLANVNQNTSNDVEFLHEANHQRKTELDSYLPSSSNERSESSKSSISQSPYFEPSTKRVRNKSPIKPQKTPDQMQFRKISYVQAESPDEIQICDESPSTGLVHTRPTIPQKSHKNPADGIVGNTESTRISQRHAPVSHKNISSNIIYKLHAVRHSNLVNLNILNFVIDETNKTFAFDTGNEGFDDTVTTPRSLSKIMKIFFGNDDSNKLIVSCSHVSDQPDKFGLELESHKTAMDLMRDLLNFGDNITSHPKPRDWIDKAFGNCNSVNSKLRAGIDISTKVTTNKLQLKGQRSESSLPNSISRRRRHVDELDPPQPQFQATALKPRQPVSGDSKFSRSVSQERASHDLDRKFSDGRQFFAEGRDVPRVRAMRSQITIQSPDESIEDTESKKRTKFSETGQLGEPWKSPLVFPQSGKKRETIQFEDLWRLDEDEFLNDSLVGFFLRYLEHKLEKNNVDLYKKMYFFNSYFYDSLTKGVKGKKGINFDGVAKWTRNVNLFSRDFVIVPVNENLHWYVAIICNLPQFLAIDKEKEDVEDQLTEAATPQNDEHSAPIRESDQDEESISVHGPEATQESFAQLSLDDVESSPAQAMNMDPAADAQVMSSRGRRGSGRRKHLRRSLPKYETNKPVIITLDSLGNARSMTCSTLRQYVALEAKDKQNLEIDPSSLKGMTAKGIPSQSNFSDCGLYLCMYLEQFVKDPHAFVARLLQRQESSQKWPKKIHSAELRARLREMILSLHREQEGGNVENPIPEIGRILIDTRDPFLEDDFNSPIRPNKWDPEAVSRARERCTAHFEKKRQQREKGNVRSPSPQETVLGPTESSQDRDSRPSKTSKQLLQAAIDAVNEPIVIEDEAIAKKNNLNPEAGRAHDHSRTSHLTLGAPDMTVKDFESPDSTKPLVPRTSPRLQHADPLELAHYLRQNRNRSRSPTTRNGRSRYRQRSPGPQHPNYHFSLTDRQAHAEYVARGGQEISDLLSKHQEEYDGKPDEHNQNGQRIVLGELVAQVDPPAVKRIPFISKDEVIITDTPRNRRSKLASYRAKRSTMDRPRGDNGNDSGNDFDYIGT